MRTDAMQGENHTIVTVTRPKWCGHLTVATEFAAIWEVVHVNVLVEGHHETISMS